MKKKTEIYKNKSLFYPFAFYEEKNPIADTENNLNNYAETHVFEIFIRIRDALRNIKKFVYFSFYPR